MKRIIKNENPLIENAEILIQKIQSLKEAELEDLILIPLFKALGYDSVEKHGGPNEHGIDLICWKTDELDEIEVAVVQVKRFKPTKKSKSSQSFAGLITQMSQACEESIANSNGQKYLPRILYFVTPYQVDTRILNTRFNKYSVLRQQRIKIIDGNKLRILIKRHLPHLEYKLLGEIDGLQSAIIGHLNNQITLRSLRNPFQHPIESFYTNIDFYIGSRSAKLFLLADFEPKEKEAYINEEQWPCFKELISQTKKILGINLTNQSIPQIEDARKKSQEYKTWLNKQFNLESIERNISLNRDVEAFCQKLLPYVKASLSKQNIITNLKRNVDTIISPKEIQNYLESEDFINDYSTILKETVTSETQSLSSEVQIHPESRKFKKKVIKILPLLSERNILKSYTPPNYIVKLNSEVLCQAIERSRKWLNDSFNRFQNYQFTNQELKEFLRESGNILHYARDIFKERYIVDAIFPQKSTKYIQDETIYRLEMSTNNIFDSGLNILLLGEAGAGKTTSLQMYTKIMSGSNEVVYLFIPLTSLLKSDDKTVYTDNDPSKNLLNRIIFFLSQKQCFIDIHELSDLFNAGKIVLILDGIDEVISNAPWLLDALDKFSKDFPKTQLITSSRSSGETIDAIKFITITLLPFSKKQRDIFINKWFTEGTKSNKSSLIINHLKTNKLLSEVVKNPLLATIMCTLQEKDIPLPENEVRLYNSRLDLLLGSYDAYKGSRRLKSQSQDLYDVAEWVAYSLHIRRIRELELSRIYEIADNLAKRNSNILIFRKAIDELVNPCNILVPMTDDGKIGFGHLRFQEHLTAKFLCTHRNIDLFQWITDTWWNGVFILIAMMQTDIEWLILELSKYTNSYVMQLLDQILNTQSKSERKRLLGIVEQNKVTSDKYVSSELYKARGPQFD